MISSRVFPEMRCCYIATRDETILKKIIDYCTRIQNHLDRHENNFEIFKEDLLFQDACCMCVVQIGELVALLSDDIKESNKSIPWRIIKDTRNFYVHSYGSIDIPSVWDTLINDIPSLAESCKQIFESLE